MATMTLGKWGNARGVRIPLPFCNQLNINVGDPLLMHVDEKNRIIIEPAKEQFTLSARMKSWDGVRYTSEELAWGEPEGDEIW